jgi:hypothetical protein
MTNIPVSGQDGYISVSGWRRYFPFTKVLKYNYANYDAYMHDYETNIVTHIYIYKYAYPDVCICTILYDIIELLLLLLLFVIYAISYILYKYAYYDVYANVKLYIYNYTCTPKFLFHY